MNSYIQMYEVSTLWSSCSGSKCIFSFVLIVDQVLSPNKMVLAKITGIMRAKNKSVTLLLQ